MQFQPIPTPHQRGIRRIPTTKLQTMKHIRENCMRNSWGCGPGRASRPRIQPHVSTPGTTGVKGAGGTGGHGRASRRGAERSEALASRAAGPSGARNTRGATSNTINWAGRPRGADGERAGRPRGGRRSVGGGSDNCRNHSPARRSTSCMMRPHTALTHATAETPRTRERQGRICRKSSKP